jgi:hypothetical protein
MPSWGESVGIVGTQVLLAEPKSWTVDLGATIQTTIQGAVLVRRFFEIVVTPFAETLNFVAGEMATIVIGRHFCVEFLRWKCCYRR